MACEPDICCYTFWCPYCSFGQIAGSIHRLDPNLHKNVCCCPNTPPRGQCCETFWLSWALACIGVELPYCCIFCCCLSRSREDAIALFKGVNKDGKVPEVLTNPKCGGKCAEAFFCTPCLMCDLLAAFKETDTLVSWNNYSELANKKETDTGTTMNAPILQNRMLKL